MNESSHGLPTGKPIVVSSEQASGADKGSTLLPMLVWGLILSAIGMMVVMLFV